MRHLPVVVAAEVALAGESLVGSVVKPEAREPAAREEVNAHGEDQHEGVQHKEVDCQGGEREKDRCQAGWFRGET